MRAFERVDQLDDPAGFLDHLGQDPQRQQRGKVAGQAGQRARHAQLGAIVAILGIEGIADKAAIAGAAAEEADLALPLRGGGADQRQAGDDAGVADQQPGGEIVGSVDDEVVAFEQRGLIVGGKSALDGSDGNEGIQAPHELRGKAGLGLARVAAAVDRLAVEIGEVGAVGIDDGHLADARTGQRRDHRRTDPARADHQHARGLEPLLPGPAELGQDDLAGVAGEFFVGQQAINSVCAEQSRGTMREGPSTSLGTNGLVTVRSGRTG